MRKIKLGDKVKDKITGFSGVVVAYSKWITGCDTVNVQPTKLRDGKPIEPLSIDVTQVELIKPKVKKRKKTKRGGPRQLARSIRT